MAGSRLCFRGFRLAATVAAAGAALLGEGAALAADFPCGPVEAGSIHVDGMTSDWEGVQAVQLQGGAPAAAQGKAVAARVYCNYDEQALYLLIDVADDIVARTPAATLQEDHLELAFLAAGKPAVLGIWPRYRKLASRTRWMTAPAGGGARIVEGEGPAANVRKGPPAIEEYDSLQRTGYTVELRLPLRLLPGYRRNAPLPLGLRVVDGDSTANPAVVSVAETGPLDRPGGTGLWQVRFAGVEAVMSGLYDDVKAGPEAVTFEASADLGRGPGRVLVIGRYLAVVASQEYSFKEVAGAAEDIREVKLIAPGPEALQAVAIRSVEKGGLGTRELLRIYRCVKGGGDWFQPLLEVEVGKQLGSFQLSTQVAYVQRGKLTDVVLTPQAPRGFGPDNYAETPATDVIPILLPWRDKRVRYLLRGGIYVRD